MEKEDSLSEPSDISHFDPPQTSTPNSTYKSRKRLLSKRKKNFTQYSYKRKRSKLNLIASRSASCNAQLCDDDITEEDIQELLTNPLCHVDTEQDKSSMSQDPTLNQCPEVVNVSNVDPIVQSNSKPKPIIDEEVPKEIGTDDDAQYKKQVEYYKKKILKEGFLDQLLLILAKYDLLSDFFTLLEVIVTGRLDPKNIAFLACLDRAIFASLDNATQMRYRKETRAFWEAVHIVGKGRVTRLLGGPNARGQVKFKNVKKSKIKPSVHSRTNFAIPSTPTLTKGMAKLSKNIPPGFIDDIIAMVPKDKQYILAYDGKSLVPGIDKSGNGQVDLWGCEQHPTKAEKLERKAKALQLINDISENNQLPKIPVLIQTLTYRIKELREYKAGLERAKMKWEGRCDGTEASRKKYANCLGHITVGLFSAKSLISQLLELNEELCLIMSKIHGNQHNFHKQREIIDHEQGNLMQLLPPDKLKHHYDILGTQTQLCKQGSDEWMRLRKECRISGSSAANALGMNRLMDMQEHYKKYIKKASVAGVEYQTEFTPRQLSNMQYGKNNEKNGVATLVGMLLPAYLPRCYKFVERGTFFIGTAQFPRLMAVSPDGLLACTEDDCSEHTIFPFDHENIAVEIKCPVPKDKHITEVHYKIPEMYLLQVMAEMKAQNVDKLFYVCYTKQSTTLSQITFNPELWDKTWSLIEKQYGIDKIKYFKEIPAENKQLKECIKEYIKECCMLLAEIPSVSYVASGEELSGDVESSPFQENINLPFRPTPVDVIEAELSAACMKGKELIEACYKLKLEKATELITFVLSDIDRSHVNGMPLNFPIAYGLGGSSTKLPQFREMLEQVRNRLHAEDIDVLCEACDGHYNKLLVRSHQDKPLTRLQVSKDTWALTCKLSKEHMLKDIVKLSSINPEWKKVWAEIEDDEFTFDGGNLRIIKKYYDTCKCDPPQLHNRFIVRSTGGIDPETRRPNFMSEFMKKGYHRRESIWKRKQVQRTSKTVNLSEFESVLDYLPDEVREAMEEMDAEEIGVDNGTDVSVPIENNIENEEQIRENEAYSSTKVEEIRKLFLQRGDDFLNNVTGALVINPKSAEKIKDHSKSDLIKLLGDAELLFSTFTIAELKLIEIELQCITHRKYFRSNMSKRDMCNVIGQLFCSEHLFAVKKTSMKSLKQIATEVVLSKSYPAKAMATLYAHMWNPLRMNEWEQEATTITNIDIPHENIEFPVYAYPDRSYIRHRNEPRLLDPTHLLTNIRSMVIRKGLPELGVYKQAWLDVVAYDSSIISLGYVTEVVEKQSAAVAQQFFSYEVEKAMHKVGRHIAAFFVHHVRNFYDACDKRGLSAEKRITYLLEMHYYFMYHLDIHSMPPPTTHVLGLSATTFEGVMQNISIRIVLYFLSNTSTYNHRAAGTLTVESLFGELALEEKSGTGNIRATDCSKMWRNMAILLKLKHDPDKGFYFQTASHNVYPVNMADFNSQQMERLNELPNRMAGMGRHFKNHPFDLPESSSKRKRKTQMSRDLEPLCGVPPLRARYKYRLNEAEVNPAVRNNLMDKELAIADA